MHTQEEKTAELEKIIAVDRGKSDLVEKLVYIYCFLFVFLQLAGC